MNPEQERKRLQAIYSLMDEGELRKVAGDATTLTPVALETLRTEIAQREIDIPVVISPPGTDVVEFQKLVAIRRFRDLPHAVLAKGLLESAGIECFLADDNMVRMDWFISNLVGGVKLLVKARETAAANEILDQPIPETFDVDGVGGYEQPHCPECGSMDTTFEELNKPVAYGSAWVGLPIPLHDKGWRCKSCGYHWDNSVADENGGV